MILIITGPQASGKGIQAESLKDKFGLIHFSMGDVLRELVKTGGETGKKIDEYMNRRGALVPDEIASEVISRFLTKKYIKKGIIFDGYPRTKKQLEILEKLVRQKGASIDLVLYLYASEKVINQRLSGRLVCPRCGRNYHTVNMPPKIKNVCDDCKIKLVRRKDENPEAIKERLAIYRQETAPLLQIYRKMGILEELDGDEPPKNVFADILVRLEKAGLTK
ncbi:MAG TPA: nucleoside monophosphate kinase [Candidatus Bathyarchaeia archaeon]|nr:nucleoside monophosphate kinase [Candidatus Bathyarchaeia archaeon]